jgi:hypothetical protein
MIFSKINNSSAQEVYLNYFVMIKVGPHKSPLNHLVVS